MSFSLELLLYPLFKSALPCLSESLLSDTVLVSLCQSLRHTSDVSPGTVSAKGADFALDSVRQVRKSLWPFGLSCWCSSISPRQETTALLCHSVSDWCFWSTAPLCCYGHEGGIRLQPIPLNYSFPNIWFMGRHSKLTGTTTQWLNTDATWMKTKNPQQNKYRSQWDPPLNTLVLCIATSSF